MSSSSMNKKIIETIFEKIILNTINKCFYEYEYDLKAFEECAEKYGTFIARLNHSPYLSMMSWTLELFVCVFNILII